MLKTFPLLAILLAGAVVLLPQPALAAVTLYPAPAGLPESPRFGVQVNAGGAWSNSYVNFDPVRASGSGATDQPGKSFSWTTFETTGPTTVRVQRKTGSFSSVIVRPTRVGITATNIGGNTVEFTMQPGQKVSVEFNTDIKNPYYDGTYGIPSVTNILMVFADPVRAVSATNGIPAGDIFTVTPGIHQSNVTVSGASPPTAGLCTLGTAGGKKVVVFGPGVYDIGYWQVPNNIEHIHLAGGAVVFGAVDVIPQGYAPFYDAATINNVYRDAWSSKTLRSSFKVTGPGVLSGAKLPWHLKKDFTYTSNDDWWAHVKGLQLAVTNITVEDVTIANSPHWVLSFINDDDERTKGTFDNFKMVSAWTYNNDGLPNPSGATSVIKNAFIHADDDAFKIYNSNSRITNCVVWQANNGAVIQFGWFPKTVSNVRVDDIDVIHFENWYGQNQVNRAVINYANAGGSGVISGIQFNNFIVEGRVLRLFGLNTVGSAQVLRNIGFNNLSVGGMGVGNLGAPGANYFIGVMTNWAFTNFVFEGTNITSPALAASVAQFEYSSGAGAGFTFTSGTPNTPPAISPVGAQTMGANSSKLVTFTVGDAETAAGDLAVTGGSSNSGLLPNGNIVHGGSGSNRNVTLFPIVGQTGTSTVTLTVSDGSTNVSTAFLLTVTNAPGGPNTAPTLSAIASQGISVGGVLNVNFTVGDAEQSALALVVSGTSSNSALVPDGNLVFSGSGSNRTLTVTPLAGQAGVTLINVIVSDGYTNGSVGFQLAVTNAPPVITAQPGSQTVNLGQNASFNVGATGSQPLAYQWFTNGMVALSGATNAALNLINVQPGDAAAYSVVVANSAGSVTSAVATLTVNTNVGGQLYWIGGTASGIMSNTNNYRLNPDGTGGAPAEINAEDVIEYTASAGVLSSSISQSTVLTFGAFHNNTSTAGSGYIFFNGSAGTGTWNIRGATVEGTDTITNAAFINDQNRGFNFKADVVLEGGGDFVFKHASGSSGEYQGNSFGESGGRANVVFQGQTPSAGNALYIWGKSDGSTTWGFTGDVVVREKATVDFTSAFDISGTGGRLIVDPASTGARFKMGRVLTFTVAELIVRGTGVAPGSYTKAQLNALLSLSGDAVFEGTGASITVTGGTPANTPPTISPVGPQPLLVNSNLVVNFTVGDAETAAGSLSVSGTSGNPGLIPDGHLLFGGSGSNRNVTLTPLAWQLGAAQIILTVGDGQTNANTAFVLTVTNLPAVAVPGNLLTNGPVEAALTPWTEYNPSRCDVQLTTNTSHTGESAARVYNRNNNFGGVQQNILDQLTASGPGYYTYAARGRTETGTLNCYVTLRLIDAGGTRYFAAPTQGISSNAWSLSTVTNQLIWTNLTGAFLYYETSSTQLDSFVVDDLSLRFLGTTPGGSVPTGSIIAGASWAGGQLILSVSNGLPGGSFDLLRSTNIAIPPASWTPVNASNTLQFDQTGMATVTNPVSGEVQFFRVREPLN